MMRKVTAALLAAIALLGLASAHAEQTVYTFSEQDATLTLPDGVYDTVLTPGTLSEQSEALGEMGTDEAQLKEKMAKDGVLLRAYDKADGRVLTVTAVRDSEAEQYFNINEHTPETRAAFRRMHSAGDFYRSRGYYYTSVEWKTYASGRWLTLKYDYKPSGETEAHGCQRRTIVNGYTITLDLSIQGKGTVKPADVKAINRVLDGFAFTEVKPLPELPVKLIEKQSPPTETSSASFTMKGMTAPGAQMTAVLGSFSTTNTTVLKTTAKKNGSYTLDVTLPGEDMYFLTLTVQKEGKKALEKQYAITYRKGLLDVTLNVTPLEVLSDTTRISGKAEKGAAVELNVNGKTYSKKAAGSGAFSFSIDTSEQGDYDFRLKISKAGYEDRLFNYTGKRIVSEEEKVERVRSVAQTVSYAKLRKNIDKYDGKTLMYEGYLVSAEEKAGEWMLKVALEKKGDSYAKFLMLSSDKQPAVSEGASVRVYGVLAGTVSALDEGRNETEYPKLQLKLIEAAAL